MESGRATDSPGLGDLPMEILALIVAHLTADGDLCRARAAHRCFHASPQGDAEKRLARWRGQKTPEQFCAVGLVEALAILTDRGAILGPTCVWAAVEHGHCDVLAFLVARGVSLHVGPRRRIGAVRAPAGFVSRATRRVAPHTDLIATAASGGHLGVVQFLHAHGVMSTPSPAALDSAAANGHLDVIRWLHATDRALFTATTDAMDKAAAAGHLDVVRFLDEHRDEGCTEFAMTKAAIHGHLDVVAYLHEHRTEACTDTTYMEACLADQPETSYYLLVHNIGADPTEFQAPRLSEQFMGFFLVAIGSTETSSKVFEIDEPTGDGRGDAHRDNDDSSHSARMTWALDALGSRADVMNLAARHGFLGVVEWLHKRGTAGCTTDAMDGAAIAGHLHVVQWLHVHRSEGCTEAALASTHPGIVRFLLAHRPADCRRPKPQ